jgi:hypothetical protein
MYSSVNLTSIAARQHECIVAVYIRLGTITFHYLYAVMNHTVTGITVTAEQIL